MIPFAWAVAVVCGIVLVLIAGLCTHPTSRGFVRNNAEGIKIALLIGAALYAAWVYNREATDNRIANTLAFKERAETGSCAERSSESTCCGSEATPHQC